MGKPAARVGDLHVCPMVIPGAPPVPHVGGPVIGPGVGTVLIGGMPAATMSDSCLCSGPPDTVVLGSTSVMIGGRPAARMGDPCAHGGVIVGGAPTVLIGDAGNSAAVLPAELLLELVTLMPPATQGTIVQILSLQKAARKGQALAHDVAACPVCSKKYA